MTAKDFSDLAGCMASKLAQKIGLTPEAWRQMVSRGTSIKTDRNPDRLARLTEEAEKYRDEVNGWIREMRKADKA